VGNPNCPGVTARAIKSGQIRKGKENEKRKENEKLGFEKH
jgi:hypothetical protein